MRALLLCGVLAGLLFVILARFSMALSFCVALAVAGGLVCRLNHLAEQVSSGGIKGSVFPDRRVLPGQLNPEGNPLAWFDIGDASGDGAATFYIDEIRFVASGP